MSSATTNKNDSLSWLVRLLSKNGMSVEKVNFVCTVTLLHFLFWHAEDKAGNLGMRLPSLSSLSIRACVYGWRAQWELSDWSGKDPTFHGNIVGAPRPFSFMGLSPRAYEESRNAFQFRGELNWENITWKFTAKKRIENWTEWAP